MSKYVVLCDCGKPPAPYIVAAWIDDNRTDGGSVDVYATKMMKSFRLHPNRGGGMHEYQFGCPRCGKKPLNLAQDTVAEMLDTLILPTRHMLEVKDIPVPPRHPNFTTVESEQRYVIPIKVVRRYVNELKTT